MADAQLTRWLRKASMAEICERHDPFDRALEGALYASQRVSLSAEQEAAARQIAARWGLRPELQRQWMDARQLVAEGKSRSVVGAPLGSESVAPFSLDGREYNSVWSFYQSLKLQDGDPGRAAVASGARRRVGRTGDRSFGYGGQLIAVNSVEHGVLVARATEAKVRAHEHVQRALLATGAARLYMGDPGSQALGRYMPFALMVMRLKLG